MTYTRVFYIYFQGARVLFFQFLCNIRLEFDRVDISIDHTNNIGRIGTDE